MPRLRIPSTALLLAATALLAAGCGTGGMADENADASRGKQIFAQSCGACHALADAGTRGSTGPNLDSAFAFARTKEQKMEESTIREVVLQQIRFPAPPMPGPEVTLQESDDREEDAEAIAAYVASAVLGRQQGAAGAGQAQGGGQQGAQDGKSIFASAGCGSCHVLSDAGSTGTTGPNLDESKPDLQEAIRQIANGGGGMPAYKDQLTQQQIRAVARYVSRGAGK